MPTTRRTTEYTASSKDPFNTVGKKLRTIPASFTVTSAGAAIGDIYILSGPHSVDSRIVAVLGTTGAMTSANDNDLGFYKKLADGTFAQIGTGDELWNGVDLTSAKTYQDLLLGLNASLDTTKTIRDFLSLPPDQEPFGGVYLGFRTNVASTAATITNRLKIVVEEATQK